MSKINVVKCPGLSCWKDARAPQETEEQSKDYRIIKVGKAPWDEVHQGSTRCTRWLGPEKALADLAQLRDTWQNFWMSFDIVPELKMWSETRAALVASSCDPSSETHSSGLIILQNYISKLVATLENVDLQAKVFSTLLYHIRTGKCIYLELTVLFSCLLLSVPAVWSETRSNLRWKQESGSVLLLSISKQQDCTQWSLFAVMVKHQTPLHVLLMQKAGDGKILTD